MVNYELLVTRLNEGRKNMSGHLVTTGFLVEIDGKPQGVREDIASAKQETISLANGVSSMKITSIGPGITPCSAWYWDYAISDWVFSENSVFAEAKRKDE